MERIKDSIRKIVTVDQHIMKQQRKHPSASGSFSLVMVGITLATKFISAQVRRAGFSESIGATGEINVQGEKVQKLDEYANQVLMATLGYRSDVSLLASEELAEPIILNENGNYAVFFDPLDGSTNIDVGISVGTVFSILSLAGSEGMSPTERLLQPGSKQIAAGYVIYGSSTVLVYTSGDGVHLFTLDPGVGAYRLVEQNLRIPHEGPYYSMNEGNYDSFSSGVKAWLADVKKSEKYSSRYVGTLIADFHRTLIKGGIFTYPVTAKSPQGKLRLMYEANPVAFIAEQAGGIATDGKTPIMQKIPKAIHERTALIVGSPAEVEKYLTFTKDDIV